jgi:5-enolpyruvylshikimate-3-phosphate synthase
MAAGLRALDVGCAVLPGGLAIDGRDLRGLGAPGPVELPAPADHRVVMALSLLGTLVPAGVRVGNREAVAKSWPGFFAWLGRVAEVT